MTATLSPSRLPPSASTLPVLPPVAEAPPVELLTEHEHVCPSAAHRTRACSAARRPCARPAWSSASPLFWLPRRSRARPSGSRPGWTPGWNCARKITAARIGGIIPSSARCAAGWRNTGGCATTSAMRWWTPRAAGVWHSVAKPGAGPVWAFGSRQDAGHVCDLEAPALGGRAVLCGAGHPLCGSGHAGG